MSKRVLIAPLHWGLGHATRCVPIIKQQIDNGCEVFISANGHPRGFLETRFPSAKFIDIPFMEITYPKNGNMTRHFLFHGLGLLYSIWQEHRLLQSVVKTYAIDLVISDSRFGLWTAKCKCVFITHQVKILSPYLAGVINMLNRWVMRRYDEVWIPDYEQAPGLAGELSHPTDLPKNAKYIGPKSRFGHPLDIKKPKWDTVAIVSGPEPQRSLFEAELARQFIERDEAALIIQGKPNARYKKTLGKLKLVNHLEDEELLTELAQAKRVIARSGYSTIMDFAVLGIRAEFHPTPGQTEQEYLAQLHR